MTFANDLGYSGVETFAYSGLGQVEGIIGEVKASGDGLTWNELLSYDEDRFDELLHVIPSDILSAIPVIGGHYNYFSLEASYNPAYPVLSYAIDSQDEGSAIIADYGEKLASSWFALLSLPGENGGLLYEKSVQEGSGIFPQSAFMALPAGRVARHQWMVVHSVLLRQSLRHRLDGGNIRRVHHVFVAAVHARKSGDGRHRHRPAALVVPQRSTYPGRIEGTAYQGKRCPESQKAQKETGKFPARKKRREKSGNIETRRNIPWQRF